MGWFSHKLGPLCEIMGPFCQIMGPSCEIMVPSCEIMVPSCEIMVPSCEIMVPSCEIMSSLCHILDHFDLRPGTWNMGPETPFSALHFPFSILSKRTHSAPAYHRSNQN